MSAFFLNKLFCKILYSLLREKRFLVKHDHLKIKMVLHAKDSSTVYSNLSTSTTYDKEAKHAYMIFENYTR